MKAILFAVALAAVTIACGDSEPVTIAPTATATATETAMATETATASTTASAQPSVAATATQAQTAAATATVEPTASATATVVTPPEVRAGDASGAPFSTLDVRVAVEEGRGYSFWLIEERDVSCDGSAVPGHPYWSANLAGSDFGPVFVLWVYPDADALKEDWDAVPGEAPTPRIDCELPSGFVYWNENLIMAFDVWFSLGEPLPLESHWESPSDMPAVEAFLELGP